MTKAEKEPKVPVRVQRIVDACRGGANPLQINSTEPSWNHRRPMVPAPIEQRSSGHFSPTGDGSPAPILRRPIWRRVLADVGSVTP